MRIHTRKKPYNCSLCNKSFNQSSILVRHKRCIHSNRRPYHCPFCGKLFKVTGNLMSHIRVHAATQEFSCIHCLETFRWRIQLKRHLLKSHDEGTWLTCHICQKKCSRKSELRIHIWRHEGVKPYVCNQCPKCFCTGCELKSHQLTHCDFKGFCCGLCGKDFKRPDAVKRHFKRCSDGDELNFDA